ncbi:type II toxin-antitoxin system CcdA family antitoxin [Sulfuricurvum sp.]|uniref:type II toxin-antitoxin system CcdA family antitoxin n=1 Tax=Sulfuricurvum sp. TaxID=2025608 RepID=UPI00260A61CF|nr:type II toxin-antitoxin system CcdA family antitoxin [Sulfuricurvum sp.]MDD2837701.1 type II toxin-antitoxin system CcdA family antitoxin [Sulfuricurvum sp.]MDD3597054.1 type II toxin-antitoxin system CcdA family antitoxin [Sulfuricurvum sp.]
MTAIYNPNAPKKSANLSINSDLLQQAKELKINLSKSLEEALTEKIIEQKERMWLRENKSAIDDYNQRVQKLGVFSNGLRRF